MRAKIPEFTKEEDNYHTTMAKIILANNHDLVIESALLLHKDKQAKTFKYLKKSGWQGIYIGINPEFSICELEKQNPLFNSKKPFQIPVKGDGMDNKLLENILTLTKPENPVYVVNYAIEIMLKYQSRRWTGINIMKLPLTGLSEDNQIKLATKIINDMNKIWAGNLSKTGIKTCYLLDHLVGDKIEGVPLSCDEFKQAWENNNWNVDVVDSPFRIDEKIFVLER